MSHQVAKFCQVASDQVSMFCQVIVNINYLTIIYYIWVVFLGKRKKYILLLILFLTKFAFVLLGSRRRFYLKFLQLLLWKRLLFFWLHLADDVKMGVLWYSVDIPCYLFYFVVRLLEVHSCYCVHNLINRLFFKFYFFLG